MQVNSVGNFIRPLNYALSNKSDVSSVFKENIGKNLIKNISPVKYPNAKSTEKISEKIDTNKAYNDIAKNLTPGYNASLNLENFSQIGNSFDAFV